MSEPIFSAKRKKKQPQAVWERTEERTSVGGKRREGKARLDEGTAKRGRKGGRKKERHEKKYKNTLDRKMAFARYSRRASNCLPPVRTFRRSSPIRTPEKYVSKEHRCRHN